MASCKDCIHENVCEKLCPRGLLPYQSDEYPAELFCLEFKNKADVMEVKHGEWEPIVKQDSYLEPPYGDTCKCSVCGYVIDVSETVYNYCPNCGADMRGTKDE